MHSMYTRNMPPDIDKFSQEEGPVTLSTDFPTCRRRRDDALGCHLRRVCELAAPPEPTAPASRSHHHGNQSLELCGALPQGRCLCSLVFSRLTGLFRVGSPSAQREFTEFDAKQGEHGFQTCNCRFTLLRQAADGNTEHLPHHLGRNLAGTLAAAHEDNIVSQPSALSTGGSQLASPFRVPSLPTTV